MEYNFNPGEVSAAGTKNLAEVVEEPKWIEPIIPKGYFEDVPIVTMEIHNPTKRDFMDRFDRYEPVVKDHTSYITAKECLRKYFFQIVLGFTSKTEAIYFAWGSSYHKYREVLETIYGFGGNEPEQFDLDKAVSAFTEATNAGMKVWNAKGMDQPVGSKWEFMTSQRLMKSFIIAFNHWKNEKIQNRIKVVAVEQAFNLPLSDGTHISGRADQIVRWAGKPWGRDFKTSAKDSAFFARSLSPNNQFTLYTYAESKLAGEQVQGQMVEQLFNAKSTKAKVKGPEIHEHQTSRSTFEMQQWEKEIIQMNEILDSCRDNDTYPAFEVSCPFCPFHSVCSKGTEGAMMSQLEAHFRVRPWDNTKVGVIDD